MREQLLEKMELLRQQMVEIGTRYGLHHPEVLRCSREIDLLHNQLLQMEKEVTFCNDKPFHLHIFENRTHFA
ncbi:aspartyl-phosphate phosphatase Spo0E family protein [Brevibacillus sp. 7WMA2]|uniref:aspartyl-phosphate phosphatase Spo0E family protein n=1 Tax=Brevibacillus TaxID=55080 RepID=UPI000BCA6E52|nr:MULTISPECIES: aspartyl-phosphate phosphatase Spo0E family protein [Brevibacillus]PCN42772.1 sporulation protein Spo0E [Brevibacillus laterosporus]QIC06449.1 aspartyl-phosphate phosphatase Spo0E family protein [Brevibacillus sp. 7WMA2]